LPTVTGLVLVSNAETGVLEAVLDAGAVTSLRTGAAAVLAATTLGAGGSISVVGCGVNGAAAARTFAALGLAMSVWDVDAARAGARGRGRRPTLGRRDHALRLDRPRDPRSRDRQSGTREIRAPRSSDARRLKSRAATRREAGQVRTDPAAGLDRP